MDSTNETPLISVILSVYNDELNIKNAIESILSQTYKNIELLVLDDFSTDKTYEIISELNDNRLTILRNSKNLGLTKSLNILINNSNGEILARQDSDDISLENRLEIQYKKLVNLRLDACTTRAITKQTHRAIPKYSHYFPIQFIIRLKNPFIHGTLMIKKAALNDIGLYDENLKYAQDYKLFIDLMKKKYKIKILKNKLYVLNMENNISTLNKKEQRMYFKKIKKENL